MRYANTHQSIYNKATLHDTGPAPPDAMRLDARQKIACVNLGTSAVWAEDVCAVSEEAASDQRRNALVTLEAITMPVALLKRDELGSTKTSNRLGAATTLLGEEFTKAAGAVWLLIAGGELLAGKHLVAVRAGEAISMPRGRLVRNTTFVDHTITLHAALSVLFLVTRHTYDLLLARDETLVADRLLAHLAAEARLMPLLPFIFILLHTCAEDVSASVAAGSEVVIMAVGAVQLLVLSSKRLVDQGVSTVTALEAFLMPMFLFVRQVLGVAAYGSLALFTGVGEEFLVAFDAVRMLLAQDVTVTCEIQVTVETAEMSTMPVLIHCFRVLSRKNQLELFAKV